MINTNLKEFYCCHFIKNNDKYKSERILLLSHLSDHAIWLKALVITPHQLINKIKHMTGKFIKSLIVNHINSI